MQDTEIKTQESVETAAAPQKKHGLLKTLLALLLIAALCVGGVGFYIWSHPVMPEVIGMAQSDAEAALNAVGFHAQCEERYNNRAESGIVLTQSALSELRYNRFKPVILGISMGLQPVLVEDVSGMSEKDATAALSRRQLTVETKKAFSEEIPLGKVMEQSVAAGERLMPGDSITITVSKGPETSGVPEVIGRSSQRAEKKLKDAGYNVDIKWAYEEGAVGEVVWQDPAAGTKLKEGSTVSIILSMGESRIIVPDLHGMGRMEAALTLEGLGLTYTFNYQENGSVPYDHVCFQSVKPGQSLLKGENVFFYLAK